MTGSGPLRDVAPARLDGATYAKQFADAYPALSSAQALVESSRCLYCYDAPCATACPTGIAVPTFIRQIATGNLTGAARTILQANPLGAMCARVCPTEVLCEGVCVRNTEESPPVAIGRLQRYATDHALTQTLPQPLFSRAAATGHRIAIVGAGPAGLACAHTLACAGHDVVIFDAREKAGGLNEFGIAAYKAADNIAQREVAALLDIGGIDLRLGLALGRDLALDTLLRDFDAVFLAIGLAGVNALGLAGETAPGVEDAVAYIARLRQQNLASLPVGRRVVVIGGGMTAVDIAVQSRKLGAEEVSIVYRRGTQHMGASAHEQAWARQHDVRIVPWARPIALRQQAGEVVGVDFARTRLEGSALVDTGTSFSLEADMVFKAIGQTFIAAPLGAIAPTLDGGRIVVDDERRTSIPGLWAGGDCVAGGLDLTVAAVEDGKRAAQSIDRALRAPSSHGA